MQLIVFLLLCFCCFYREGPAKKTHVLHLDMSGRFAINIVDNLIIVHHDSSKVNRVCFHIKTDALFLSWKFH